MARRGARWSSDDRGTFIQVATRPPRPGSARDAGHLARIDRATTSLVQQGRRTRWTIAGVFLALGLAALGYQAGSIWLSSAPLNTTRTVIVIVAIAACVGIAAAVLTGELGREPRGVIRSLTREGLCASCTADLSEADIEEDGCVVCLECGAAWHI
jgi:hypothetical protein